MNDNEDAEDEVDLSDGEEAELASRRAARSGRVARNGEAVRYGNPDIVTTAPCRNCKVPVEVTETGMFTFKSSSAYLVAKGENPLSPDQVMVCDACRVLLREHLARNGRKVVDKLAWCVRIMRDGGSADDERQAIDYLNRNDNQRTGDGGSETVKYWMEKRAKSRSGKAEF